MYDLHNRNDLIALEHSHMDHFLVLADFHCRFFSVFFPTFLVKLLVGRVGVQINLQIALHI